MTSVNAIKESLNQSIIKLFEEQVKVAGIRESLDGSLFEGKNPEEPMSKEDWIEVLRKHPDHQLDQSAVYVATVKEYVNSLILENLRGLSDHDYSDIPLEGYCSHITTMVQSKFMSAICDLVYKPAKHRFRNPSIQDELNILYQKFMDRGHPTITRGFVEEVNKLFGVERLPDDHYFEFGREITDDPILNLEFRTFSDICHKVTGDLIGEGPVRCALVQPEIAVLNQLDIIGDVRSIAYLQEAYEAGKNVS